jgi:putative transposase
VKFTAQFDAVIESGGVTAKRNTPRSPNLRAHVERYIQTMQVECLDKFVVVGERHLNHINREWRLHYNRERPHERRGHLPPEREEHRETSDATRLTDIVCTTRLGGLLKHYSRRAA